MLRKSKRSLAILLTLAMLATLFVGVPMANAAAEYSAGSIIRAQAGISQDLGYVRVKFNAADAKDNDHVIIRLPADFNFNLAGTNQALNQIGATDYFDIGGDTDVQIRIPSIKNAACTPAVVGPPLVPAVYGNAGLQVDVISDNEIRVKIVNASALVVNNTEEYVYLDVALKNVAVPSGFSGEIGVIMEGKSGSPFINGTVVVGTVGAGKVTVIIDSLKSITTSDSAIDAIRIKEDRAGAFGNNQNMKFKLPNGFKWDITGASQSVIDGDPAAYTIARPDDRTLTVTSANNTSKAAYVKIDGLKILVNDETIAKLGEVTASLSGTATYSPDSIAVAKYGEYNATTYAVGEPKTVLAGRTGATSDTFVEIGKFAIEEGIKGSLLKDRTITFQLVGGGKWVDDGTGKVKDVAIETADSKNYTGVLGTAWDIIGSSGDTARVKIAGTSGSACKVIFKGAKVSVAAGTTGEIKLVVGGTAGVSGEFVVANIAKPIDLSVEGNAIDVVMGTQMVELPSLIVTENYAEAIDGPNRVLTLEFPDGVTPQSNPKIEVIEGDIVLDMNSIGASMNTNSNRWGTNVTIKSTSSKPSKIKYSGIKLNIDRTVPVGSIVCKAKGTSVVQNTGDFPGNANATSAVVGNLVTPAPGEQKAKATFTIGETKYLVNGIEKTMDVAPYIKNDRTYMPIRYVAMSLGVAEQNIVWDDSAKAATLIKGDKIVQVKIGSNVMLINGISINMDVAPEITSDRTMLPLRWIGQAFGADFTWDDATKTATMNL